MFKTLTFKKSNEMILTSGQTGFEQVMGILEVDISSLPGALSNVNMLISLLFVNPLNAG